MTKTELICSLIVMAFSLITATMILSDRISERNMEYRKLKTVIALVLSVYSSLGLATFAEYYYSPDFKVWQVFLVGFSIFGAYLVVSVIIGLHKIKKDEEKRLGINKQYMKKSPKVMQKNSDFTVMKDSLIERDNSCMVTRDNLVERENCYKVANDCCRIVSIEDAKKYRKGRK